MRTLPPFSAEPADEGIPAADAGGGAPEPAPGYGTGGEDPDVVALEDPQPEDGPSIGGRETPFRTPDPREIGGHTAG
jgi:hypothetical protein